MDAYLGDVTEYVDLVPAFGKAVYKGDERMATVLLKRISCSEKSVGFDMRDQKAMDLSEALFLAAYRNHMEMAKLLVKAGAVDRDFDYFGFVPGEIEEGSSFWDLRDRSSHALKKAAVLGHVDMVHYLLKAQHYDADTLDVTFSHV